jgi:sRNA-binding protein
MEHQAKIKKSEEIKTAIQWLLITYPECFNQKNPKPLKLKIEKDIFKDLSPDHNSHQNQDKASYRLLYSKYTLLKSCDGRNAPL